MPRQFLLPGLDRLLAVIQQHEIGVEISKPGNTPPPSKEQLAGLHMDPLLAAAYNRVGGLSFNSWHSLLIRNDDERKGLVLENEEWRRFWPHPFWPEQFRALMLFGRNMGYRYATVPALANQQGLQPVVYLDSYEEIHALPIASTVDRFFDLYSRYVQRVADEPDFRQRHVPSLAFPWDVPELLTADGTLVEMIGVGAFDRWMYSTANGPETTIREWVSRIAPSRQGQA